MDKNLVLALVLVALVGLIYLFVKIASKKYGQEKVGQVITDVKEGLEKADSVVHNMTTIIPEPIVNVADTIIRYAYIVVSAVEQGYKKGAIEKDLRKTVAMEKLGNFLKVAGIDVTEDLNPLMDDAIEAEVSHLPKSHVETKTTKK